MNKDLALSKYIGPDIKRPAKAIRAFCIDCCGDNSAFVRECTSYNCPLYPFRFGKNPYSNKTMSEEQKQKLSERPKKS